MKFSCPECGQRVDAGEDLVGQVADCPGCGEKLTVPGQAYRYWAFLSYSHQDNLAVRADGRRDCVRWAEWLHHALETYRVPPEFGHRRTATGEPMPPRFFPVFQDEKELPINADLGESIGSALQQSRFLIVICSPRSAASQYVNQEVRYFKQLGRAHRILALMIDGEPNASFGNKENVPPELECFCPAMRHPLGEDGLEDPDRYDPQEPIAGDVRLKLTEPAREARQSDLRSGHRSVLEHMKLKLLAGLMGAGFDEVVQRDKVRSLAEAKQKARRAYMIAGGFAVLLCAALLSAVIAYKQRNRATEATNVAIGQKNIANDATKAAMEQKTLADQATQAERRGRQRLLIQNYKLEFQQLQVCLEERDRDLKRIRDQLNSIAPAPGDPDMRGWEWYYLASAFPEQYPAVTFPGRTGVEKPNFKKSDGTVWYLSTVAWSPSGRWLATAFSPRYVSSGGAAGPLDVWDAETGTQLQQLSSAAISPAWSSDGSLLAAIAKNRVQVWQLPSGKLLHEYVGRGVKLRTLAWRPGTSQLAAGGAEYGADPAGRSTTSVLNGELLICDMAGKEPILNVAVQGKGFREIAWSPDGAQMLANWQYPVDAKPSSYLSLLDPANGNELRNIEINVSTRQGIKGVTWTNDGQSIVCHAEGVGEPTLSQFDAKTRVKIASVAHFVQPATNPKGNDFLGVAIAGSTTLVKHWEPDLKKVSTRLWLPTSAGTISRSPDGRKFVNFGFVSSDDRWEFSIWEIDKLAPDHETWFVHSTAPGTSSANPSTTFAWSGDGKLLASGGADGEVCVCDALTGEQLSRAKLHGGALRSVSWYPDSDALLSVGQDGNVMRWPWRAGQKAGFFGARPEKGTVTFAELSHDGHRVAVGETNGKIAIWDAERATRLAELIGHSVGVSALKWHPRRDEIASVDESGKLILWDCKTGKQIAQANTEHRRARYVAYDAKGEWLASCGDDQRVRTWNATTLEPESTLTEHGAPVVAVGWNPADGRLASVDDDGVIWISEQGHGLLRIQDVMFAPRMIHQGHWFAARHLAWSPDGLRLAAGGHESPNASNRGVIHIWNAKKMRRNETGE